MLIGNPELIANMGRNTGLYSACTYGNKTLSN